MPALGGTAGSSGSSGSGESGSGAADAGTNGDGDAGAGGTGDAGAPARASGGASHGGQSGDAGEGSAHDAGAGGADDESNGGASGGDAGRASADAGEGGRVNGDAGDAGRANGAGGEGESGGNGGAHAGGRDSAGGAPAEGGVPGVAGAAGSSAGVGGDSSGGEGGEFSACDDAERCDGLDNDCSGDADEGGVCPESCRGFDLDGRAYMFCTAARGHFASAAICEDAAMDLVRVDSARENAGVLAAARRFGGNVPPGSIHLGATDFGFRNEGNFRWPDGSVFWIGTGSGAAVNGAYENWDRDEPNNYDTNEDCVEMFVAATAGKAGLWNDVKCTSVLSFVCEE